MEHGTARTVLPDLSAPTGLIYSSDGGAWTPAGWCGPAKVTVRLSGTRGSMRGSRVRAGLPIGTSETEWQRFLPANRMRASAR